MGRSCVVTTRNGDKAYQVVISPEWLLNDDKWQLDLQEVDPAGLKHGTSIEIRKLHKGVSNEFDTLKNKEFFDDFSTSWVHITAIYFTKDFRSRSTGRRQRRVSSTSASIRLAGVRKRSRRICLRGISKTSTSSFVVGHVQGSANGV
jgi:hypothetical protein